MRALDMTDTRYSNHQSAAGCVLLIIGSLILFWIGQAADLFVASTPWWVLLLLVAAVIYVVEVFGKEFRNGSKS